jgi:hypothetical protein
VHKHDSTPCGCMTHDTHWTCGCCTFCCSGRGRVAYEDLSEGEQLELQQLVLRYLNGELGTCFCCHLLLLV